MSNETLYGKFIHKDILVGEENFKIGTELNETVLSKIIEANIPSILISSTNSINKGSLFITNHIK